MNIKEENICRLCLKIAETDFQVIDEITRNMFEVLPLRMNLDVSKEPITCKDCTEILIKCFNFKSACMDIAEHILSFANDKHGAMFELKNVFEDRRDVETFDDILICRFCSNRSSKRDFASLDALKNDVRFAEKLQMLMPEMDLDIIKNLVICTSCRQDLDRYIKFVKNCLVVEEKIIKYCQSEAVQDVQIKLSEIYILELNCFQINAIKQEEVGLEDVGEDHSEVYNSELIKADEALDIKDEAVNFNETAREVITGVKNSFLSPTVNYGNGMRDPIHCGIKYESQSNKISSETGTEKACETKYKASVSKKKKHLQSTNKTFNCALCSFQAKQKRYLKCHMLIHKNVSEVEMHKCSMCTFQARQKGSLKKHMLIHKPVTEVEMHKCSICNHETKRKDNFKIHMLIHKNITDGEMYKCSMCTFQAKQKGYLRKHMLIHRDFREEEMHKCSMCSYKTKRKTHLIRHMLIHKNSGGGNRVSV